MLKDFNLLEIFWDYDIIVTIDMPSLGYYPALGLYLAGQSRYISAHGCVGLFLTLSIQSMIVPNASNLFNRFYLDFNEGNDG